MTHTFTSATARNTLLRLAEVIELTGMKKSTIYRLIKEGQFPAPIHPAGTRISCWSASDVEKWVAKQIATERDSVR